MVAVSTAGCSGCTRRWTSFTQAHCQACHEQFGTHGLADKHHADAFTPQQTCQRPEYVRAKNGKPVFRASPEAGGVVWRTFERNTSFT